MSLTDAELALREAVMKDTEQYTQLCRICLVTAERNFRNMTRSCYDEVSYLQIYYETVGKKVTPFGKFPARICSTCEIEMLEAYKFRKKCLFTDEKIKKIIQPDQPTQETTPQIQYYADPQSRQVIKTENQAITLEGEVGDFKPRERKKKFRCKVCRVIFEEYETFRFHKCMSCEPKIIKDMRVCHKVKKRDIEMDEDEKDKFNISVEMNKKRHRKKGEYTCDKCGKISTSRQGFLLHMDKHNNTARYDCDQCDKKFRHWQSRRTHIYRDHLNKPLCSCPHCGKSFYQIKYMNIHIQEIHSDEHKGYQCEKCGKNFKTKTSFKDHQNTHKPAIECNICGKNLKTRKTYIKHLEMHTGERNYVCPVCDKTFTCNFTMKKHVSRSHPDQIHLLPPQGTIVNKKYLRKFGMDPEAAQEASGTQDLEDIPMDQ